MKKLTFLIAAAVVISGCSPVLAIIDGKKIREKDVVERLEYYKQYDYADTVVIQKWMNDE